ncbi:MAG: hypothetical protein R3C28_02910 [Pirellulaceae bacterium]
MRAGVPQEIFLLKAKPKIIVIFVTDGSSTIGDMRSAIRIKNFGHYQKAIVPLRIGKDGNWFQQTV